MTRHTHRQKGRNVARLIREGETWGPRVSPRHAMEPRGGLLADLTLASTLAYVLLPLAVSSLLTLREIGSACGPRVYLRCSTSRAKYYASVLLCDHPDDGALLCARAKGLWLRVLRRVFTRWHTPSDLLHACYTRHVHVYRSRFRRRLRRHLQWRATTISNRMENSRGPPCQFVAII